MISNKVEYCVLCEIEGKEKEANAYILCEETGEKIPACKYHKETYKKKYFIT